MKVIDFIRGATIDGASRVVLSREAYSLLLREMNSQVVFQRGKMSSLGELILQSDPATRNPSIESVTEIDGVQIEVSDSLSGDEMHVLHNG